MGIDFSFKVMVVIIPLPRMVKLAEVMVQLSTVNSEKSPDQTPLCAEQAGVGLIADVGVNAGVGVSDGADVGVTEGATVEVGITIEPNSCAGAQLNITKLKSNTNIMVGRCLAIITFSCAVTGAPGGLSK